MPIQPDVPRARAPLSLRVAVYLLVAFGILELIAAAMQVSQSAGVPIIDATFRANAALRWVFGFLYIAIAIGLFRGSRAWRSLGAILVGLGVGSTLARVLFTYWPLGSAAWDVSLAGEFIGLVVGGWLLWALTNAKTILFCNDSSRQRS